MSNRKEGLKEEIDYITKHQELNKFNYEQNKSILVGIASIIIAIWASFSSLGLLNKMQNAINLLLTIILLIVLFSIFLYVIRKSNLNFMSREDMIERRYKPFKVYSNKLKKELDDIYNRENKKSIKNFLIKLFILWAVILNIILWIILYLNSNNLF